MHAQAGRLAKAELKLAPLCTPRLGPRESPQAGHAEAGTEAICRCEPGPRPCAQPPELSAWSGHASAAANVDQDGTLILTRLARLVIALEDVALGWDYRSAGMGSERAVSLPGAAYARSC